jgi:hypothetical protein
MDVRTSALSHAPATEEVPVAAGEPVVPHGEGKILIAAITRCAAYGRCTGAPAIPAGHG